MSEPVIVEGATRFAVGVHEGFDYITEISNWHEYWPRLVSIDPASRWGEPGDRARLSLRLLGREVELELALVRFEPYALVEYTSVQRGIPPARHRRSSRIAAAIWPTARGLVRAPIRMARGPRPDRDPPRVARSVGETLANLERRLGPGDAVQRRAQEVAGR